MRGIKQTANLRHFQVFLVFVRLSTHKESSSCFMDPEKHGSILMDNGLIDMAKIFDICTLFRTCNPLMLNKMVENLFKNCGPRLEAELSESVDAITETFNSMAERTETMLQNAGNSDADVDVELSDLAAYSVDICSSIEALLQTRDSCSVAFHEGRFEATLANFYQNVIVALWRHNSRKPKGDDKDAVKSKLQLSRLAAIASVRHSIQTCCLRPILEGRNGQEASEDYLDTVTSILSEGEGTLLVDYTTAHPVEDDLDLIEQAGLKLDLMRVQYLIEGIAGLKAGPVTQKPQQNKGEAVVSPVIETNLESDGAGEKTEDDEQMDSLISQVKDLLPHLGGGFVEAALEYFDKDPEKVINSLLEENLPPHLIEMDRETPRKPKRTSVSALVVKDDPLFQRNNLYDGDEFDVVTRDTVDLSKIHRGKSKRDAKNANVLLDDKTELASMRDRFMSLGVVTEDVIVIDDHDPNYDDEYDDTYDQNAVGQSEPDAKDELLERRPFVLPRALGGGHVPTVVNHEEEEEEEEEEDAKGQKRDEFVRNPADIRADNERKRQERQQQQSRGRRRNAGPPPNRDVVGGPRGQGQSKEVVINRNRKTANKGKHNRAMADKKQAKGMF